MENHGESHVENLKRKNGMDVDLSIGQETKKQKIEETQPSAKIWEPFGENFYQKNFGPGSNVYKSIQSAIKETENIIDRYNDDMESFECGEEMAEEDDINFLGHMNNLIKSLNKTEQIDKILSKYLEKN